jgi:hypothetical protein
MNEPRSEYDYGTAAIQLMTYGMQALADLNANAERIVRLARTEKIERCHAARADRTELTKALRWVFRTYPQHFSVMR